MSAIRIMDTMERPVISSAGKTLRRHRDLILNHFRARKQFSSGVVEGLNNKVKVTVRKAYGFRISASRKSPCIMLWQTT